LELHHLTPPDPTTMAASRFGKWLATIRYISDEELARRIGG
jgi:hypothetical protein